MRSILPLTVVFTLFLCFNYAFGFYLFPMLLPDMGRELGFSYALAGAATAAAQIGFIVGSMLTTEVAAKLGPTRVVIGSTGTCGLCLLTIGLLPHAAVLALMLVAMGALAASVWIPMVAVVGRHVPERRRGTVLGIFSSAGAFGAILNSAAVPWVVGIAGWRTAWIAAGGLTCITVAVGCIYLARTGILSSDRTPDSSPQKLRLATVRFVLRPHVVLTWAVIFLGSAVCLPYQTYLSAFIREGKGFDAEMAANAWKCVGLAGIMGGGLMGAIADRAGTNAALILTSLLVGIAAAVLWLGHAPEWVLVSGVLYGLSYYAIFGLIPNYISKTVPAETTTAVFSIANVMVGLGGAAGNLLGGWVQAFTGSLSSVYVCCAAGAIILLVVVLFLPTEHALSAGASPMSST